MIYKNPINLELYSKGIDSKVKETISLIEEFFWRKNNHGLTIGIEKKDKDIFNDLGDEELESLKELCIKALRKNIILHISYIKVNEDLVLEAILEMEDFKKIMHYL